MNLKEASLYSLREITVALMDIMGRLGHTEETWGMFIDGPEMLQAKKSLYELYAAVRLEEFSRFEETKND